MKKSRTRSKLSKHDEDFLTFSDKQNPSLLKSGTKQGYLLSLQIQQCPITSNYFSKCLKNYKY